MLFYLTVYVKQTDLWSQPPKLREVEKASETKKGQKQMVAKHKWCSKRFYAEEDDAVKILCSLWLSSQYFMLKWGS